MYEVYVLNESELDGGWKKTNDHDWMLESRPGRNDLRSRSWSVWPNLTDAEHWPSFLDLCQSQLLDSFHQWKSPSTSVDENVTQSLNHEWTKKKIVDLHLVGSCSVYKVNCQLYFFLLLLGRFYSHKSDNLIQQSYSGGSTAIDQRTLYLFPK